MRRHIVIFVLFLLLFGVAGAIPADTVLYIAGNSSYVDLATGKTVTPVGGANATSLGKFGDPLNGLGFGADIDKFTLADSTDWDMVADTTNYTISMWIYPTDLPESGKTMGLVQQYEDATNGWSLFLYNTGSGINMIYRVTSDNNNIINLNSIVTSDITTDEWRFLQIAKNGTTYAAYFNGTRYNLIVDADTDSFAGVLGIGNFTSISGLADGGFVGSIDDVVIQKGGIAPDGTIPSGEYISTGAPVNTITANFSASNTSGIQPLLVQFTDTSTTTDATIDSWAWDFGDGNISALQNPSHTYTNAGEYQVNLTITNTSLSLVSTKLSNITVYYLPACDFTAWNTAGNAPHTTYLYDTSSNLNPGPYTYYWDMGDGNTSTEQNLYYTWNETGTYTVSHSITDSVTTAWENKTAYVTVGSPETAPVASFYGGPQLGAPPLQVFFTDVSTNTPTSWNWSHGDGTYSIIQNPTHWYNKSGFYTVGLTASNGAGSNTSTQTNFVMVY